MAVFFWERSEDQIPSALVASWMFGSMAHHMAQYETDAIDSLKKNKLWVLHYLLGYDYEVNKSSKQEKNVGEECRIFRQKSCYDASV